uniref:ACT domain-containing protein ACR4-like n=1 Tax=Erigeron canadensis TaxID=72917 RepID=UPI001CB8A84C|nr:ACT domain-containing protein ACR4-like [Erigeron canadensis]
METISRTYSRNMEEEYEKFIRRMNPPRVVIDNESCKSATIIQVDSANKHGILLEVVQVLTDLNFIVTKAYISSDGGWFMDVFNVTDSEGNKITDEEILNYIQKVLGSETSFTTSMKSIGVASSMDRTVIELIGTDRPGLLSEVCAVLTHLKCNVINAEVWTHNTRAAFIVQVTDDESGLAVIEPERLSIIKQMLSNVLEGSNKAREAKTVVSNGVTHTERRLHQMMLEDRDFEGESSFSSLAQTERPDVNVVNWYDKDCSVVTIRCKDRPKLLFDTICTLTDMEYVVFHGNVDADGTKAYQEYCIRHVDGSPVKSEAERERMVQCIEAAIERRVSEGLKLELCTTDRIGLLSDVTRIFRENSLTVTRAEVATRGGKAVNTFYVRDASGCLVDSKIIDSIRKEIGQTILKVKYNPEDLNQSPQQSPTRFLFGGLFKSKSFCNFGLVRSYP